MGTNSAPLLADLFLHTFEYDFMVKTMKHDITKAIQFSNTFRYIDDLFSINNVDFGNYISTICPSELQLTPTSTSSTEVCYLDTNIKTGSTKTPFWLHYPIRHNTTNSISITTTYIHGQAPQCRFILLTICIQTSLQDNKTLACRTASATSQFILLTICI